MVVRLFAPTKINLMLRVVGRHADGAYRGYHAISSLVVFGDYGDTLTIAPKDDTANPPFIITGNFKENIGADDNNFVGKAIKLCAAAVGKKFSDQVTIEKKIPIGGGLGGGTSDGIAMLKYLGDAWHIDSATQMQIAQKIGADGLALFHGRPCIVSGIGDIITPLTLPDELLTYHLLLVWDGRFVSTSQVFSTTDKLRGPDDKWDDPINPVMIADITQWETANGLEAAAFALHPALQQVKNMIKKTTGCVVVNMTGSGGCFYALFDNAVHRRQAMVSLSQQQLWAVECGFYKQ